jgi:hypothetical protein
MCGLRAPRGGSKKKQLELGRAFSLGAWLLGHGSRRKGLARSCEIGEGSVMWDVTLKVVLRYCWGLHGSSGENYLGVSLGASSSANPIAGSEVENQFLSARANCRVTGAAQALFCWGATSWGSGWAGSATTGIQTGVTRVSHGGDTQSRICIVKNQGVLCSEYPSQDWVNPMASTGLTGFTDVSTSNTSSCALKNDGRVYCWGQNASYQLGNKSNVASAIPVQVKNQ